MIIKRIPMAPERRVPPPTNVRLITAEEALRSPVVADLLKGIPVLNHSHQHSWQDPAGDGLLIMPQEAVKLAAALADKRRDYEDEDEIKTRVRRRAKELHQEHPELDEEELVDLVPPEEWKARPVTRAQLTSRDLWHEAAGWIAKGKRRDHLTGEWEEFEEFRAFFDPGKDCFFVDVPGHPLGGYWLFTLAASARRIGERLRRDGRPRAHWAGWDIWANIHKIDTTKLTPEQKDQSRAKYRQELRREADEFARRGRDAYYRLPRITAVYEFAKALVEIKRAAARAKAKAEKEAKALQTAQAQAVQGGIPYMPTTGGSASAPDHTGNPKVIDLNRHRPRGR